VNRLCAGVIEVSNRYSQEFKKNPKTTQEFFCCVSEMNSIFADVNSFVFLRTSVVQAFDVRKKSCRVSEVNFAFTSILFT